MSSIFFNKINTKPEINANHLQNSVASTDLTFYTWGGSDSEDAYDIAVDSSNNSYVVGYTKSFGAGDRDICLIKFNASGVEWNRTFGGIYSDWGRSIVLDSFDNIYITGYTESFGTGGSDIWLLKINSTGSVEWNHTWGGEDFDEYNTIAIDSNDSIYVAGTYNYGSILMKYNSSGYYDWNFILNDYSYKQDLAIDNEENILFATEYILIKFNSSGNPLWNYTLNIFLLRLESKSFKGLHFMIHYMPC